MTLENVVVFVQLVFVLSCQRDLLVLDTVSVRVHHCIVSPDLIFSFFGIRIDIESFRKV